MAFAQTSGLLENSDGLWSKEYAIETRRECVILFSKGLTQQAWATQTLHVPKVFITAFDRFLGALL